MFFFSKIAFLIFVLQVITTLAPIENNIKNRISFALLNSSLFLMLIAIAKFLYTTGYKDGKIDLQEQRNNK